MREQQKVSCAHSCIRRNLDVVTWVLSVYRDSLRKRLVQVLLHLVAFVAHRRNGLRTWQVVCCIFGHLRSIHLFSDVSDHRDWVWVRRHQGCVLRKAVQRWDDRRPNQRPSTLVGSTDDQRQGNSRRRAVFEDLVILILRDVHHQVQGKMRAWSYADASGGRKQGSVNSVVGNRDHSFELDYAKLAGLIPESS